MKERKVMSEKRVLIVDDRRDIRRMLRASLESLGDGLQVLDVPSGEEAMLEISRYPVDLLVADMLLPGISGLELREQAQGHHPEMKFILITGVSDPKIRREAANSGADAFFFKPIELSDFLEAVELCLGIKQALVPQDHLSADEAEEETLPSLSERLSGLRQERGAISALLIDSHGEIVAQAGEPPDGARAASMISSLLGVFSASAQVSYLLDSGSPDNWLYFNGREYDLLLSHIGQAMGLLLVLPDSNQSLTDLLGSIGRAKTDLAMILQGMGVSIEETTATEPVVPAVEAEADEALPEFEDILSLEAQKDLRNEDVDAFWESAMNDNQGEVVRSDTISYDQAKQLGLTPGE